MTMTKALSLDLTNAHDEGGNGEKVEEKPADVMVFRTRMKRMRQAAADE